MGITKRFASEEYVIATAEQIVADQSIPTPESAQVGQIIVVSAVDENGRVIATEAATDELQLEIDTEALNAMLKEVLV